MEDVVPEKVGGGTSHQTNEMGLQALVDSIPFGSTGKGRSKAEQHQSIENAEYETLDPAALCTLLTASLRDRSASGGNEIIIRIEEGSIPDGMRRDGWCWIILGPPISDQNRLICISEVNGRKIRFEAGAYSLLWAIAPDRYFIKMRTISNDWISFSMIALDHGIRVSRAITIDGEKEKVNQKDGKSNNTIVYHKLENYAEIMRLLGIGGSLRLAGGFEIPMEKRRDENPTLWICLDYGSSADVRKFRFVREEKGYMFYATVDTHRRDYHDIFVQIKNEGDWKHFKVIGTVDRNALMLAEQQRREKKEDQEVASERSGKEKSEKSRGVKRNRQETGADKEKALEVFNFLYGDGDTGYLSHITLKITSGKLRDIFRQDNGPLLLVLDYSGRHWFDDDVITFGSKVGTLVKKTEGPTFKALVTASMTNAKRHGKLFIKIQTAKPNQYDSFRVLRMCDLNGGSSLNASGRSASLEKEAKIKEVVIDLNSDQDNPEPVESAKKHKPESAELPDAVVIDDGGVKPMDLGDDEDIGAMVTHFVNQRIARASDGFKDREASYCSQIQDLETQLNRNRRETQEIVATMELLRGEIEVLKSTVSLAETQKNQAERKLAAVEKSLKERPIVSESTVVTTDHQKVSESFAELQKKYEDTRRQNTEFQLKLRANASLADKNRLQVEDLERKLATANRQLEDDRRVAEALRAAVPISPEDALEKYIKEHEVDLRQEAKDKLLSMFMADAYRDILEQSVEIRTMVENGFADAIAEAKTSKTVESVRQDP